MLDPRIWAVGHRLCAREVTGIMGDMGHRGDIAGGLGRRVGGGDEVVGGLESEQSIGYAADVDLTSHAEDSLERLF
jgi:hypothetical protein